MKIFLCCCALFIYSNLALSASLQELEAEIVQLSEALVDAASGDDDKINASDKIEALLLKAFKKEGVFEYSFENLVRIGCLESGDGAFRLFNWNIPLSKGTFSYRAILLFPDGKHAKLSGSEALSLEIENRELAADQWYGALYYEIHPVKAKKNKYYTLIGWDGSSNLSNKKVLDALSIDKKGNVQLGLPVFQDGEDFKKRRVFEYAENATMTLRYIGSKEAIVFDILEPLEAGLRGQYEFYGPSTAYSGYTLAKDGTWSLIEIMDMSRPKDAENGAQFNFPDRPDINRQRKKVNPLTGQ